MPPVLAREWTRLLAQGRVTLLKDGSRAPLTHHPCVCVCVCVCCRVPRGAAASSSANRRGSNAATKRGGGARGLHTQVGQRTGSPAPIADFTADTSADGGGVGVGGGGATAAGAAAGGVATGVRPPGLSDQNWWSTVNQFKPREQRAALTQARVPAAAAAAAAAGAASPTRQSPFPPASGVGQPAHLAAVRTSPGVEVATLLPSPVKSASSASLRGGAQKGWAELPGRGSDSDGGGGGGGSGAVVAAALLPTRMVAGVPTSQFNQQRPQSAAATTATAVRGNATKAFKPLTHGGGAMVATSGGGIGVSGSPVQPHPPSARASSAARRSPHPGYHVSPADGVRASWCVWFVCVLCAPVDCRVSVGGRG